MNYWVQSALLQSHLISLHLKSLRGEIEQIIASPELAKQHESTKEP